MTKIQILLSLLLIISTSESWLPEVSGYSESDANNGYAGLMGYGISCLRMTGGQSYRVHVLGGSWLPAVTGNSENDSNNGYAGVIGKVIDAVAISGGVTYKAHVLGGGWLPAVNGYNTGDANNGYAGIIGKTIDAIMINGRNYAVYYEGGSTGGNTGGGSCSLVNYGTGIASINYQMYIPNMTYGCCFMSACVKGGLCTTAQISAAYSWALSAGKIEANTYVLVGGEQLAKDISAHYGTQYHSEYYFNSNYRHFWLVNSSGKEIFNSAGLGWH